MRTMILGMAAAVAAVASGHAYAGSQQYPAGLSRPIYAAPPLQMTGSQAYPAPSDRASLVRSNAAVSPTGSVGYQDFAGQPATLNDANTRFADGGGAVPSSAYRFEVAGRPSQNGSLGKMHQVDSLSIMTVRLVRLADGAAVSDVPLTVAGANMGPDGMPNMTARVRLLSSGDGLYRFEIHPGMSGNWAIQLAANVPGGPGDLRGAVVTRLVL